MQTFPLHGWQGKVATDNDLSYHIRLLLLREARGLQEV